MSEDADIVEFDEIVALALAVGDAAAPRRVPDVKQAADGARARRRRIRPGFAFQLRMPTIAGCRIRCPASG